MFWSSDDQDPGSGSCLEPGEGAVVDDIKFGAKADEDFEEDGRHSVYPTTMGDERNIELTLEKSEIGGAAPEMSDNAASVVKWWMYHVNISKKRSILLGKEIDPDMRRQPRQQLTVGLAMHFGAIDGVALPTESKDERPEERFPRISCRHAKWLDRTAKQPDAEQKVSKPTDADHKTTKVFPRRVRVEDCWRVMRKYRNGQFHYSPGDVVEVLGNDMAWHPGVVTFSRSYQDGLAHWNESPTTMTDGGDVGDEEITDGDDAAAKTEKEKQKGLLVNVIRPNGKIEYGNLSHEVRPNEEAVRVLFGRAPWLWQQHALLRAERLARFEENHPEDFNEIDWAEWGRKEFLAWVNAPERPDKIDDAAWEEYVASIPPVEFNPKFGEYYRAFPEGVQEALLACLLEPFLELDAITAGEDDEGWDFDEEARRARCTFVSRQ
jgi:hypothetical protein